MKFNFIFWVKFEFILMYKKLQIHYFFNYKYKAPSVMLSHIIYNIIIITYVIIML